MDSMCSMWLDLEALEASVKLSCQFIADRYLPDKAHCDASCSRVVCFEVF